MALLVILLFHLLSISSKTNPSFNIASYSWISTDSKRDLSNAHLLMPMLELSLHSQTSNSRFNTDCGQISVLHLPDIPFQLQFIQTSIKDNTDIFDFEQEMDHKWNQFMQTDNKILDPFFNNNLAFFVPSIDIYLQRLEDIHQSFYSLVIEWQLPITHANQSSFYSLIVHSPESSIMYEFISNHKPLLISLWMKSDIPRSTFDGFSQHQTYPWDMRHELIPIRIGRSAIDIEGSIDWHRNIFNSVDIYIGNDVAFILSPFISGNEIQIEIGFFHESRFVTDFTVDEYLSLVNSKHDQLFCGIDEWFFNCVSVFGTDLELDVYVQMSQVNGYHYRIFSDKHLYHLLISNPMTGYAFEMVGHLSYSLVDKQFLLEWNSKLCQMDCSSVQNAMEEEHKNISRVSIIEENNEIVCFLIICIVFGICAFCFMNENRKPKNISEYQVKNAEMIPLLNI